VLQARHVAPDLEDLREERRRHDDRDRPTVIQDVREIACRQQCVRRDRHRADLDRAEERVDELRRIEAEDDDALLQSDA